MTVCVDEMCEVSGANSLKMYPVSPRVKCLSHRETREKELDRVCGSGG